jgi:hypothetical protein
VTKEVVKKVPKARPKVTMWLEGTFFDSGSQALLKSQAQDYAQQMGFDLEYVQDATATMQPRENAAIESQNLPDVLFAGMDMMAKARRSRTACRRHRPGRRAKWDYGRFHQGGAHFG